jgi:UMF1 family MFS transporter
MSGRRMLLAGVPDTRAVWSWGAYDLANQSFQLLINTLLFSLYFTHVVTPDPVSGQRGWGLLAGSALLVSMLVSPIAGALADARAWKREILIASGLGCGVLIASMSLLGPGMVPLAVAIFLPAAVLCALGENFLGSFLPEISTPQTIGRVSAVGFVMSYAGALVLLGVTAGAVHVLGWSEPAQWRWLFAFAGAWYLAWMTPAILFLRERGSPQPAPGARTLAGAALARLGETVRHARQYRQFLRAIAVALVFQMGYFAVIYYASVIARNMGAGIGRTLQLALLMTIAAGVAAVLTGRFQDRLGHRRTVSLSLAVWTISTAALAIGRIEDAGITLFWIVAAGWGLGLGSLGTATRAMVGAFTPQPKAAEFFGLYGLTSRLAGVIGVPLFGVVSTQGGDAAGLFMMAGFFAAGLLLLRVVSEREGVASAATA